MLGPLKAKWNKFSLGGTAGIITSLGLIAGLSHGNNGKASIITGLLIIAIADNISDSLSIHIYKESERATKREVNIATFGNFIARLVVVCTFVLIVVLLPYYLVIAVASVWGLLLLILLSYHISRIKKSNAAAEIAWHLAVALIVIASSKFIGNLIANHTLELK